MEYSSTLSTNFTEITISHLERPLSIIKEVPLTSDYKPCAYISS